MADVEVREAPTGGVGVFVTEPVETGVCIRLLRVEREVTREAPLRAAAGEHPEHCTIVGDGCFLVASPDRYLNHSCDPNVWLRFTSGGTELVARRAIAAGEELCLDYLINNAGGDTWPCACGAARCRGETGKSFFDLPTEIRREYRPHLAAWFVDRYADRLEAGDEGEIADG